MGDRDWGQIMKQLSSQDAQFLYAEDNKNQTHVTFVVICDPSTAPGSRVRFKQIIEHVESRVHTSPIYKRRILHVPLELDFPYWVDDEYFDIEYHIRHSRLPEPGDWRQFCIHLSRFHSRPLDLNRPPWEMYVIEGLGNIEGYPEGAYAIATKISHAAADGTAVINFFGGLYDIDAKGTPVIPLDPNSRQPEHRKPTPLQMLKRGLENQVRAQLRVAETILKAAPALAETVLDTLSGKEQPPKRVIPDSRLNQGTSPHKVFDAAVFDLKDFKPIRTLVEGATINDVVLAISSGALRRYLEHHKDLPDESLMSFVPVNIRSDKGGLKEDENPGNNISMMNTMLFTNIADPVERFKAIHEETQGHKESKIGLSARLMTDVSRHIPASTQFLASRFVLSNSAVVGRITNLIISNVPGPQVPVYMNGAKVVRQIGLGPISDQMGMFLGVTSYDGLISFMPTSSRITVPDIDFFVECLRESFNELKETAGKQARGAAPGSKRQRKRKSALSKVNARVLIKKTNVK